MRRPRASSSIRWRPAWRESDVAVTIYGGRQPAGRLARPFRRCPARRPPVRAGIDVPRAKQPGPAAGAGPADRRSGRTGAAHRRDRRRSAAAPDRPTRCRGRSSRSTPASCRSRCACSSKARRMPARMRSSFGRRPDEPLAAVTVSDADLRRRAASAFANVATPPSSRSRRLLVLLLAGPLLDWRQLTRSTVPGHAPHDRDCRSI